MKKIKAFWESLEGEAMVSKRELFLGLTCCALAGYVLGTIFSPKKTTTIGSNNGNGQRSDVVGAGGEPEPEGQPEEA